MSPRQIGSLEELKSLVGQEVGTSEWVEVTQAQIDTFADATGDHQWIHVDAERARSSPYGSTIAHGFLTLSLIPSFGAKIFAIGFGGARLNYGVESVRFPHPVTVGSRIRASATVEGLEELPKGTQVRTRYLIEIEGETRPACLGTLITLITP